ncbi:MAG TPA: hypothetical protein VJA66_09105 [Thermoanaerobaculia bacterium]
MLTRSRERPAGPSAAGRRETVRGRNGRSPAAAFAIGVALLCCPSATWGFVYSEHRSIAGEAIAGLDPQRAAELETLWALARDKYESRLCAAPSVGGQRFQPTCFDLAAWSALAGDDSCSPVELLDVLLEGTMVLHKSAVFDREERELASAASDSQRRNAAVRAQVALTHLDPAYATRAGANNGHFLLGRPAGEDLYAYVKRALAPGTAWNALSNYLFFHGAALILAARGPGPDSSVGDRARWARLVLALESFADHFLEDMFAAGHVAGSWGVVAIRKGTHDFYNRNGLETSTWDGEEMLLFGDAFMTPDVRDRAARVVRMSLEQVLDADDAATSIGSAAAAASASDEVLEGRSSTCGSGASPGWQLPETLIDFLEAIVRRTAVPYRGGGPGSLPRYRAEIGPFLGLVAGGQLAGTSGGFDAIGTSGSANGSLTLAVRFGLGLEELLSEGGDGLIFLEGGVRMSSAEHTACNDCAPGVADLIPRVPARTGIESRLRLPFWLIPGDLILASPLAFFSPDTLTRMAATAANGGLIPIEGKLATPLGNVQLVLGREIGATFYGFAGGYDTLVTVTGSEKNPQLVVVGVRTISLEMPVLEWEPFRSYGSQQTLGLRIQLGAGLDMPVRTRVLDPPGSPVPHLETRYFGYLRLALETRRYF